MPNPSTNDSGSPYENGMVVLPTTESDAQTDAVHLTVDGCSPIDSSADIIGSGSNQTEQYLPRSSQTATDNTVTEDLAADDNLATDTLAAGISFMLIANVIQRAIGFGRNVAFCSFLDDDQLGLWALANSFFMLAAPLAVLGLPGCFGRFVEHYRSRDQLGIFLKRTLVGSLVGTALFSSLLVAFPSFSSQIIFGQSQTLQTMLVVAATLSIVIAFNFLTELLNGLRQPKAVSQMHATSSIGFAIFGISWLACGGGIVGLIGMYAIASMVGAVPGITTLLTRCRKSITSNENITHRSMWQRILPYAAAMWTMNLLSNLFDVVDRYMLLHLVGETAEIGQSLVGQYHCGRILPLLLSSLALMIGGLLLPYMTAEWEKKNFAKVAGLLESSIKLVSIAFSALALAAIVVAPWIFSMLTQNRYESGLSIMPLAMIHCTWAALSYLMYNYLWCAERGKYVGAIIGVGLVINVILNAILVPMWDLHGAILATTVSGGVILVITEQIVGRLGAKMSRASKITMLVPLTVLLPWWSCIISLVCICFLAHRTNWLFTDDEKKEVLQTALPIISKLPVIGKFLLRRA